MANHKSAIKKSKQDIIRRERNRSGKTRLRTALKKYRILMASDSADTKIKLPGMLSLIDKSAKKGLIHTNVANRLKGNLSRQVAAAANV